nr:MAG TPA: hypothetical protein [Caudoviricetes sp.]
MTIKNICSKIQQNSRIVEMQFGFLLKFYNPLELAGFLLPVR